MARSRRSVLERRSRRETLKISRSNRGGIQVHHKARQAAAALRALGVPLPRAGIVAEAIVAAGSKRRSGGVLAEENSRRDTPRRFSRLLCFLERSPLRRLKTSWPSLSRMRNPIVRGGNATFAAATIAADAFEA